MDILKRGRSRIDNTILWPAVWPDSAQESLARIGSGFLARIDAGEPQFLIEVELGEDQLKEIFRLASKARLPILNSSALVCLALAAIHTAAQADQDDQGFRALFYRRLGRELDTREWEQHFGTL